MYTFYTNGFYKENKSILPRLSEPHFVLQLCFPTEFRFTVTDKVPVPVPVPVYINNNEGSGTIFW